MSDDLTRGAASDVVEMARNGETALGEVALMAVPVPYEALVGLLFEVAALAAAPCPHCGRP